MKGFIAVLVLAASLGALFKSGAAEPTADSVAPEDKAAYAKLKRAEFELVIRSRLLNELAEEHARKSEEAPAAQQARADWEKDLARELRDKGAAASKQLIAASKDVMDFEQKHGVTPGTDFILSSTGSPKEPGAAEVAYISLLDDRLFKVQQELAAAIQTGNNLSTELQTNNAPEAMARISFDAQINRRQVWELEREQADLELRKFEFRARNRSSGQ